MIKEFLEIEPVEPVIPGDPGDVPYSKPDKKIPEPIVPPFEPNLVPDIPDYSPDDLLPDDDDGEQNENIERC